MKILPLIQIKKNFFLKEKVQPKRTILIEIKKNLKEIMDLICNFCIKAKNNTNLLLCCETRVCQDCLPKVKKCSFCQKDVNFFDIMEREYQNFLQIKDSQKKLLDDEVEKEKKVVEEHKHHMKLIIDVMEKEHDKYCRELAEKNATTKGDLEGKIKKYEELANEKKALLMNKLEKEIEQCDELVKKNKQLKKDYEDRLRRLGNKALKLLEEQQITTNVYPVCQINKDYDNFILTGKLLFQYPLRIDIGRNSSFEIDRNEPRESLIRYSVGGVQKMGMFLSKTQYYDIAIKYDKNKKILVFKISDERGEYDQTEENVELEQDFTISIVSSFGNFSCRDFAIEI